MEWDERAPEVKAEAGRLAGKVFVLTGALRSMTRDEAKQRLRSLGARVSGSVSKNTDYVVVGADAGAKAARAAELDIDLLDEGGFLNLIEAP